MIKPSSYRFSFLFFLSTFVKTQRSRNGGQGGGATQRPAEEWEEWVVATCFLFFFLLIDVFAVGALGFMSLGSDFLSFFWD